MPPKEIPRPTIAQQAPAWFANQKVRTRSPKLVYGMDWPFKLDFERRELRKRPTSACSRSIFMADCGRSFRGMCTPLHSRPRHSILCQKPTPRWGDVGQHGPRKMALRAEDLKLFFGGVKKIRLTPCYTDEVSFDRKVS